MKSKALQDHYEKPVSHCFGCGYNNERGLHIKSYWEGDECVCSFQPEPYHCGIPGYVYGGMIASVIDCHGSATASAEACRREGRDPGAAPMPRFVTASLHVDYLLPTRIDQPMVLRARVTEFKGRKAVVSMSVESDGKESARGEMTMLRMPPEWLTGSNE